jgi:hypothetical protein
MRPAAALAPLSYLFALFVGAFTFGTSFLVEPDTTKYVVMATGVVLIVSVLAAALRPVRPEAKP